MCNLFMILCETHTEDLYGSELSCFGIFDDHMTAMEIMDQLRDEHPNYEFEIRGFVENEVEEVYLGDYCE